MSDVLDIPDFLRAAARCKWCHGQGCEAHENDDGSRRWGEPCQRCKGSGVDPEYTSQSEGNES